MKWVWLICFFALVLEARNCSEQARKILGERHLLVRSAGLRYGDVDSFSIQRLAKGRGFTYRDTSGKAVPINVRARIESLAIPPGWKSVWISDDPKSHVQAKGIDSAGRVQRIYHVKYDAVRDQLKFQDLVEFGKGLGSLRHKVSRDIKEASQGGLTKKVALAAAVRLLDRTLIRVGERNGTDHYGLTTLREKHLKLLSRQGKMVFVFIGKLGVEHEIKVVDEMSAQYIRRSRKLPGYDLFQYLDANGERRLLSDEDIRVYLREHTGENAKPKEFRTWHAGVVAAETLAKLPVLKDAEGVKGNIQKAIEAAAERLGNEPNEARDSYIYPDLLSLYEKDPASFARRFKKGRGENGLSSVEREFLKYLSTGK